MEVFRRLFEAVVEQCQQAVLVWGQELSFDATQVLADASLDSLAPRFAVEAHAALQEHLAAPISDEANQDVRCPPEESVDTAGTSGSAPAPAGGTRDVPTSVMCASSTAGEKCRAGA